jgi:hypothetical protein
VRPVLEQGPVLVGELLEQRGIERAEAAEDDQQVVARDDAGGVELQAAQRAADVEDRLPVRPAARGGAVEPLRADGESAGGGEGQAAHGRATIITGHDGRSAA